MRAIPSADACPFSAGSSALRHSAVFAACGCNSGFVTLRRVSAMGGSALGSIMFFGASVPATRRSSAGSSPMKKSASSGIASSFCRNSPTLRPLARRTISPARKPYVIG
jgi:hypothetical protein